MKGVRVQVTRGREAASTLARAMGLAFAGLLLAACASMMPPEMTSPAPVPADQGALDENGVPTAAVKPTPPPAPSFGAPKQIGDRPVMDAAARAKMQTDLETLAKQRESDAVKELEAGQ